MKYLVIGLGYFGATLAQKLSLLGNEVIAVDKEMDKVEAIKDNVTHAICMDCIEKVVVTSLPLKDTDVVIVAIGEDQGASIMITALLKQLKVKRLISRAVSPLQETVLSAMGVSEIIHPEEEAAERWANKLNMTGSVDSFVLNKNYSLVELKIPKKYKGKTIGEVDFMKNHNLLVLSTVSVSKEENLIGLMRNISKINGIANSNTKLIEDELLLVYGNNDDVQDFLKLE
jgi:trk system potassium uptake protein TrkA